MQAVLQELHSFSKCLEEISKETYILVIQQQISIMIKPFHYIVEGMSQYSNKSSEKRAWTHVYLQKCFNSVIFKEFQQLEVKN